MIRTTTMLTLISTALYTHAQPCRIPQMPYTQGQNVYVTLLDGHYAITKQAQNSPHDAYVVESYRQEPLDGGTKVTVIVKRTHTALWGVPLIEQIITLEEWRDAQGNPIKIGGAPGGPAGAHLQPTGNGWCLLAIAAVGLGGIFHKLTSKVKEQEQIIAQHKQEAQAHVCWHFH